MAYVNFTDAFGDDVVLITPRDRSLLENYLEEGFALAPQARARLAARQFSVAERRTGATLTRFFRDALATPLPAPWDHAAWRSFENVCGGARGRVVCLLKPRRPNPAELLEEPPPEPSKPEHPPGHIMWIGFELVDQDGTPLPSVPFSLTAPDGSVRGGRLNQEGQARLDPTLDGTFGFALDQRSEAASEPDEHVDLELVDKAGHPVPGVAYQVVSGGSVAAAGKLDASGRAHVAGLKPGAYEVVLPAFEPGAVTLDGSPAQEAQGGGAAARSHTVKQGDTLNKIARAHGLKDGKTLYDAAENAALRKKRPNPDRIRPGDQVNIPSRKAAAVQAPLGSLVRLVVERPPLAAVLKLRLVDAEERPLEGVTYYVEGAGVSYSGELAGGRIQHDFPEHCEEVTLSLVGEDLFSQQTLSLVHEEDDVSSLQARLSNLGWYSGAVDGQESDALSAAVAYYRKERNAAGGAGVDGALEARIDEEYMA
jgi:hypothetical protein